MAQYEVRLLGGFEVRLDGQPVPIPGRNERRLLALLCLGAGRAQSRRDVAAQLWPEVDYEVSGNRLRTALVGLRKCFDSADVVLADPATLEIRPETVETDLEVARQLERRRQLAEGSGERLDFLTRFAELAGRELLPDWPDDWVAEARETWRFRRLEALQESADLALQGEDYDRARDCSMAILQELPSDTYAWSTYLVSMARMGRAADALRRFQAARRELVNEGLGDFAPQLRQLAKAIRDGAHGPSPELPELPPGVDLGVVRAFQRMIAIDPEMASKIVCSDAFRLEILRSPEPYIELINSLIAREGVQDSDRLSLRVMAMRAYSFLHDVEHVLQIGRDLLQEPLDPPRKRLVLTLVSFSYFLLRDLENAMDYVDRAVAEAEDLAVTPHHRILTQADRGLYVWHLGNEEEALETFKRVFEAVKDLPEAQVSYAPAYLSGVIGSILAGQGKLSDAESWLAKGYSQAKIRQYREQVHQIEPALAYVLATKGNLAEARQRAISALAHFCRTKNARSFAAALDYTAAVLVEDAKPGLAAACLAWGEERRAELSHRRSAIESRFVERLAPKVRTSAPTPEVRNAKSSRQVLEVLAAALDSE